MIRESRHNARRTFLQNAASSSIFTPTPIPLLIWSTPISRHTPPNFHALSSLVILQKDPFFFLIFYNIYFSFFVVIYYSRARVAQWWEHSRLTNVARVRILASTPYVGWVCCWFSPFLREVFLRLLRFSPLLKNQHFQIQIRSERTDTFQRILVNSLVLRG